MKALHRALETLHEGDITFDAFVRATAADWKRLAKHLRSRWSVPEAVESLDIEQELMIGAWRALKKWHPGGSPIGVHCVWNAITDAKKWIHEQRGGVRRWDSSPSRHPVAVSTLGRATEDRSSVAEQVCPAMQGERLEHVERLACLATELDELDAVCVFAFVDTGTIEGAIGVIQSDLRTRVALRIGSDDDARRIVRRAIDRAIAVQ